MIEAAPALGLGAAACWGVADFLGGLESRRAAPLLVALVTQAGGALLLAGVVAAGGTAPPDMDTIAVASVAGVLNGIAFYALYTALAEGKMARVAPVIGVAPVVPMIYGIGSGEQPSTAQLAGMAVAFAGVALLSREPGTRSRQGAIARPMLLALVAALCMGAMLVGLDRAAEYNAYWAVLLARMSTVTFLSLAWSVRRPSTGNGSLRPVPLVAVGLLDVSANVLWTVATTLGLLSIVAVLGGLFPAVTVLLSVVVLRERLRRSQATGAVMALAGAGLLSTA